MMTRICLITLLFLAVGANAAEKPCPAPLWTVDLVAKYGFQPFVTWESGWLKREGLETKQGLKNVWQPQQGVVFVSPEVLAVYQVLPSPDLPPPRERDVSGGGGKFILQVVFLDTKQGEAVRTLRLVTSSSDYSEVYPTHDGKFLMRTGRVLRLYSPAFEEIAFKSLPEPPAWSLWVLSVSPSGKLIYAGSSHPYKLALDADTLEVIPSLRLSDVALWPEGARFVDDRLDSLPLGTIHGVYTPDGRWQCFDGCVFQPSADCPWGGFAKVADQLFAKYACKQLKLFSPDAQLYWDVPIREDAFSLEGNGRLLAVYTARMRWDPLDLGLGSKPLHIMLYDLATKSEKCSIRTTKLPYYALSPAGTVAVIQGNTLSLYRP